MKYKPLKYLPIKSVRPKGLKGKHMKVLGITYFNFKDKESNRINKGVNVHVAKEVLEKMGVGYQSDKIKFPIPKFNELFKQALPEEDEKELTVVQVDGLKKYLEKEITVLFDSNKIPAVVTFK